MKTLSFLAVMVILAPHALGQKPGAIAAAAGYSSEAGLTLSLSYFHPVLMKQLYLGGGLTAFGVGQSGGVTDDFDNLYFQTVQQAFIGIRLGDYLFMSPRLSYNWYGKNQSVGWGIGGGFLIHPAERFSFGFLVSHDRIRFDSSLDRYGPTSITSLSIVVNFGVSN